MQYKLLKKICACPFFKALDWQNMQGSIWDIGLCVALSFIFVWIPAAVYLILSLHIYITGTHQAIQFPDIFRRKYSICTLFRWPLFPFKLVFTSSSMSLIETRSTALIATASQNTCLTIRYRLIGHLNLFKSIKNGVAKANSKRSLCLLYVCV